MILGNLLIPRLDPLNLQNDPTQWSANQQLAVNLGLQIAILDPKLPSFVLLMMSRDYGGRTRQLDAKQMFSVNHVVSNELYEEDGLPLGRPRALMVTDGDEPFTFSTFNETGVVAHQWTPSHPTTKGCDLAVLFSTGEMLIFGRETLVVDKYRVKGDVFETIARHYNLSYDEDEDTFFVNRRQFLALRVRAFAFCSYGDIVYMMLALGSGALLLTKYHCDGTVEVLAEVDAPEGVVKMYWSPADDDGSTQLVVVLSNNSVEKIAIDLAEHEFGAFTLVVAPLVRLNYQNVWCGRGVLAALVMTFARELVVVVGNEVARHPMLLVWSVSGVVTINTVDAHGAGLDIIVAFDDGKFDTFHYLNGTLTSTGPHPQLSSFVEKLLELFQMINLVAQDTDDVEEQSDKKRAGTPKPSNPESMRKYLNPEVEGRFITLGFTSHDNIATLVYQIVPRDTLTYTIASEAESAVAFLHLKDQGEAVVATEAVLTTALARINHLWWTQFNQLPPPYPRGKVLEHPDQLARYFDAVEAFRAIHAIDPDAVALSVDPPPAVGSPVAALLAANFNRHPGVLALQVAFMLNHMAVDAIDQLPDVNSLDLASVDHDDIERLQRLQDGFEKLLATLKSNRGQNLVAVEKIETMLRVHLARCVLLVLTDTPADPFDLFMVTKYYCYLRDKGEDVAQYKQYVAEKVTLTITTKFLDETFEVVATEPWSPFAVATLGQQWASCALTGLPILELNNRKDEQHGFNYVLDASGLGPIGRQVVDTVNYSYIDGNRAFRLK